MRTMNPLKQTKSNQSWLTLAVFIVAGLALSAGLAEAGKRDRDRDRDRRRASHGDIVTEIRDVADFSRIKVQGIADVEIIFGPEFKVEVEAGEDVIEYFETTVSGKTLKVGFDADDFDWGFGDLDWDFDDDDPLLVRITMPELQQLRVKGIGTVLIEGFDGESLEVSVSGIGDVTIRDFKGTSLELDLSGVSDVEVDGVVDELDVTLSGVGEADLRDLKAKVVYATASGLGDLRVYASESIDASASGFGDVIYYGNPEKVRRDERGFGEVVAKR